MKILIFPHGPNNPYQKLLYNEICADGDTNIEYLPYSIRNLLLLPYILHKKYAEGFRIFHLHWPNFYIYKRIPGKKFISYMLSCYCIRVLRFSRLRLVWTVHNVLPHQPETTNDLAVARYLARHASTNIIHSEETKLQMTELGMDTSRCVVIPHGTYEGMYPASQGRDAARRRFNIPKGGFVVLFFGAIKDYKGVLELIDSFIKSANETNYLLIAGECKDDSLNTQIIAATKRSDRTIYHQGFVADEKVADYFQASDVVCLPFKQVTTSGSALLAITFQKPLIIPKAGALVDIPEGAAFFYEPAESNGLNVAMRQVMNDPTLLDEKSTALRNYADSISWAKIAAETKAIYDQAIVS